MTNLSQDSTTLHCRRRPPYPAICNAYSTFLDYRPPLGSQGGDGHGLSDGVRRGMDFLEACVVLQWGMDPIKQNHKKKSKIGPKKNSSHFSGPRFWKMSKIAPNKKIVLTSRVPNSGKCPKSPRKEIVLTSRVPDSGKCPKSPRKRIVYISRVPRFQKRYIYTYIYIYIYIYS